MLVTAFHAVEQADLMPFQAFVQTDLMLDQAFVKNDLIEPHAAEMPFFKPAIRKPPISAMTVDGECIPNAALKPLIKGSKMFVTIQEPIEAKPSTIPVRTPSQMLPPAALTCSMK